MTEITVKIEGRGPSVSPPIGEWAPGEAWEGRTEFGSYDGVFLRTHGNVTLLNTPDTTWDIPTSANAVRIIGRKLKKLTIIAE